MAEADTPERFHWLRHAYIGRDSTTSPEVLGTERVAVFRESDLDGTFSYGVEHLDTDFNEIRPDEFFPTEEEAQTHAEAEYGLRAGDWREGSARDATG